MYALSDTVYILSVHIQQYCLSRMEEREVKCGGCPEPCTDQCGDCTKYCCACPPTSRISYSIWANQQAYWAGWIILGGSLIAVSLNLRAVLPTGYGLYTRYLLIPFSLIVILIEYPRGKKKKGDIETRMFQEYIAPIPYFFRFLTRNLFLRSMFYMIFSIPCFFILSTNIGGMVLLISALFYFIAAVYSEKWVPPALAYGPDSKKKITSAGQTDILMTAPPQEELPKLPLDDISELVQTKS